MLDEPSMGLAPKIVAQMFEIIKEINDAGTSVLLIEQNARRALSIANRGYLMETGSLTGGGDARVMLEDERLHEAYFGKNSDAGDG
jgi:branched-chain amino acid transport system ATP-binding protein